MENREQPHPILFRLSVCLAFCAVFVVCGSARAATDTAAGHAHGSLGWVVQSAAPRGAVKVPERATLEQIQNAINQRDAILLPAGASYDGVLEVPRSVQYIGVYGKGDRPVLNVPKGKVGIDITADQIEQVVIEGIELRGPLLPHRGKEQGIRLRVSGRDNEYARDVRIIDCKVSGFDTLIEVVDDLPRVKKLEFQEPGRIKLEVRDCILTDAEGGDSHSVGIYVEGLAEGSVIEGCAIARVRTVEPNKRSHGIYAQGHGAPATFSGNLFDRCSAQGIQARAGGTLTNNLIIRCGVGMFVQGDGSVVKRNAVVYGVDIDKDEPRGHAYQLSFGKGVIEENIAAFNEGSTKGIPAFKDMWSPKSFERNVAVQWHDKGENFDIVKVGRYRDVGTNHTLDQDPGFPKINLKAWFERERGEEVPPVAGYIEKCWKVIR